MNATEYRNELVEILNTPDIGIGAISVEMELDRIDRAEATQAVADAHDTNRMIEEENAAQRAEESGRVPDDVTIEYVQGLPTFSNCNCVGRDQPLQVPHIYS